MKYGRWHGAEERPKWKEEVDGWGKGADDWRTEMRNSVGRRGGDGVSDCA
jgi:hypothetical protein